MELCKVIDLRRVFGYQWRPDIELAEDEWTRGPRIRHEDPESACGEAHLKPLEPVMTREAPTFPGLYFVQLDAGSPIRVVEVYREHGRWLACWSDIPEFSVATSGYLFSQHPLPEPR